MLEQNFEVQLTRLFDQAPAYPDALLFNARIEQKLATGWAFRRTASIGAGAIIGLGAAAQFMSQEVFSRASQLTFKGMDGISPDAEWLFQRLGSGFQMSHTAPLVMAAVLGVSALIFALVRLVDEL
jgi:hypothetical protein